MIFSHIVVAYDGSEQSGKALEKAIRLASIDIGTKLSVIHVFHLQSFLVGEAFVTAPMNLEAKWYDHAQFTLEEAKDKVKHLPNASVTLLQGYPSQEILEYAENNGCDLIVLGSRGLGMFKEFVLGSVSHNVVQHSQIPILVVK